MFQAEEGVSLAGRSSLKNLDSSECQSLSILKAKMHGVSLIVLDCTRGNYEGKRGEKLCRQGLGRGVSGAAQATVIAQYASGLGIAAYALLRQPELRPDRAVRIHWASVREIAGSKHSAFKL